MIFQEELVQEAAELQRVIDLNDALCIAHRNNTDPEVVYNRLKLERALCEAREHLRELKREHLI